MSLKGSSSELLRSCLNTTSQMLLISYSKSRIIVSINFLCLQCFGILIDPLKCKKCDAVSCRNCIKSNPDKKLFCYCNKIQRTNFEQYKISKLDENKYLLVFDKYNLLTKVDLIYWNSLNNSANGYNFSNSQENLTEDVANVIVNLGDISNVCDAFLTASLEKKYKFHESYFRLENIYKQFKESYRLNQALKYSRMINFNMFKGYNLILKQHKKFFSMANSFFMKLIHLKFIDISNIRYEISFGISLAKAIRANRKYLKGINLKYIYGGTEEMNFYILLSKALAFCSHLNSISLECEYFFTSHLDDNKKSFLEAITFEPFSFYSNLQKLNLYDITIECIEYSNYFKFLKRLDCIILSNCTVSERALLSLMDSILSKKNIKQLEFDYIKFNRKDSTDENKVQSFKNLLMQQAELKTFSLKNRPVLINGLIDYWDFVNFSFILVQHLKILSELDFSFALYSDKLSFSTVKDFSEYIKKAQMLKKLKLNLYYCKSEYWKEILKALSMNNSILILNLPSNEFSDCSNEIDLLISQNEKIIKLSLFRCKLVITTNFAQALLKTNSLKELIITYNKIKAKEKVLPIMTTKLDKIYYKRRKIPSKIEKILCGDYLKKIIDDPCETFN